MIHLEDAKKDDFNEFLVVFSEIEELHRLAVPWKFKKPEGELFSYEYFQKLIGDSDTKFVLAKDDNKIVGYITAFIESAPDIPLFQPRKWIKIDNLSVLEKYQGKGIGTILDEHICIRAKLNKINSVELNVWSFNQGAIDFYKKKGYTVYNVKMRKEL